MAKVAPELREFLINAGHWKAYVQRREALKERGIIGRDQKDILSQEFGPDGQPNKPFVDIVGLGQPSAPAPAVQHPPVQTVAAAIKHSVSPAIWAGKPEPDERTVVKWVFENLCNDAATPADAPSMGAWGLYRECRDKSTRQEFIRTIWPKLLPNKMAPEEDRWTDKAGRILDILDKVAEASAKAKGVIPENVVSSSLDAPSSGV